MKEKKVYESIIISDVHLGTKDSKAAEAIEFLKASRCKRLILNGDIVDGWALKSGGKWRDAHTKFIRTVLKKMEKEDTEVIYLRGNHDDILERFLPIAFGNLILEHEYIHQTPKGKYLIVHGDGFDSVTTSCKAVAILGSYGYEILLRINRLYNRWRAWRGKGYFSLSKEVKARVKSAVSFVGRYEEQLHQFARTRGCRGIICGHIHTAADKMLGDVHYLNSGDWVESLTAIVETEPGEFSLISYDDFQAEKALRKTALPDGESALLEEGEENETELRPVETVAA
ncbi:MAG: UDP-2,3-diacylglucosamine diphosphatase [Verrucomicrobiae bacterium]|nr:UDP-2,3-diacylglucosamine diphosphatase [Verrucomicrobiae bacterium]